MKLNFDKLRIRQRPQIRSSNLLCAARHDAVNAAAVGEIHGVAAHVRVVPVEDVDAALGTDLDTETDSRQIVRRHEVVAVFADKAGTFRLEDVRQHRLSMERWYCKFLSQIRNR